MPMKRGKGEGDSEPLDKAIEIGKLSREDFFEICKDLEKQQAQSNKRFFELFDLIVRQRFQKEEEYKKRVSFRA